MNQLGVFSPSSELLVPMISTASLEMVWSFSSPSSLRIKQTDFSFDPESD